ncbi:MAG: hypothetical protein R3C53_02375 [Pirellulaceae bacterium]
MANQPRKTCIADSDEGPSACDVWRPPPFNLQLLIVVLLASGIVLALTPFFDWFGLALTIVYALTFILGCWKTKRATAYVLLGLYVPLAWTLGAAQMRRPWPFWYLPGLPFTMLAVPASYLAWRESVSLGATLAIFFTAILLARPNNRSAVWVAILLFLMMICESLFLVWLFSLAV